MAGITSLFLSFMVPILPDLANRLGFVLMGYLLIEIGFISEESGPRGPGFAFAPWKGLILRYIKCLMQAFGRNQISVSRFRFVSDGIFDRFQVSANPKS